MAFGRPQRHSVRHSRLSWSRKPLAIHFEGRHFSRIALARGLAPELGLSVSTVEYRLRVNGDDVERVRRDAQQQRRKVRARARERAKQRRAMELPAVLLGWRFGSFSAMCEYYSVPTKTKKADWEDHVLAGKPSGTFQPVAERLAQWWEADLLDERNRWDPAIETKMPRSRLPLNSERLPITDPRELAMLTLQAAARESLEAMIRRVA